LSHPAYDVRSAPVRWCFLRARSTGDSDDDTKTHKGLLVNIRSLTRGDGAVIGAALLLFIASFFDFYGVDCSDIPSLPGSPNIACPPGVNAWKGALLPILPTIHIAGLIAAALIVAGRMLPEERRFASLTLGQWGTALSVFALWAAIFSMFGGGDGSKDAIGAILSLLFALCLAGAAIAREMVPALKAPLMPAPRAPQPSYGYPGQPGGGYGYPGPSAGAPAPMYGGGAPAPAPGPGPQQGAPVGGQDFTPFWFAVPVSRPLFPEDGSSGAPIAELTPGVWYLAVDQRGPALIAQTQDSRRGILQDTSGIQRG
jgi:Family of unknown function (DUF5336)